MQQAGRIAKIMGEVTRSVLWELYEDRIVDALPGARLRTRIGAGRSTYCRRDRDDASYFSITYGQLMVLSKRRSPASAGRWLTAREIVRRGYHGGVLSLPNTLAHTVCHEFAHVIQNAQGQRRFGQVHNGAFYRILDGIYDDGAADLVLEALLNACQSQGIDLEYDAPTEAQQPQPPALPIAASYAPFARGDAVAFDHDGRTVTGTVRRLNRRTVSIDPHNPTRPGQYWRVPYRVVRLQAG